jgi:hypothetical protein
MRRLLIMAFTAGMLALPASAAAHNACHRHGHAFAAAATYANLRVSVGSQRHHGFFRHAVSGQASLLKLSGTGSSFGTATATANGSTTTGNPAVTGSFALGLSTSWSQAASKTFTLGTVSCAPATATLTLDGSSTPTANLSGKTCSWTPAGGSSEYGFFGVDPSTGSHVVVKQAPSGAVAGWSFTAANAGLANGLFAKPAAHAMSNWR